MLKTDNPSRDLGSIKFGKPIKFTYDIFNVSDKDIIISKIAVGCSSCTVAKASNLRVRPNIKETIDVTFTPGTIGKQKKHVDVYYNTTSLRLDFKAETHE